MVHILTAIDTIQTMLATKTPDGFAADFPMRLAVERAFEIICEASRRIPENIKAQENTIDWQRMVDFGNLLRHAHHRVDPQILLEIAARDLPQLKTFAERVMRDEDE